MSSLNDVIETALQERRETEEIVASPRLKAALRLLLAPNSVKGGVHPDDTTAEPDALQDLLAQFDKRGFGHLVQSWLSARSNEPVGPDQVEAALGVEKIEYVAKRTDLPRAQLLQVLATLLPTIIDALTPQGAVPAAAPRGYREDDDA
jgi:uncharacterized protein YidB (DUF937 family)